MDRLGHPVESYSCQQLVFCKNAFKVPLAIRPAVKLFHNPRAQTGGGIIERVAESDRLRSLLMIVRTLPVFPAPAPPPDPPPPREGGRGGGRLVRQGGCV